MIVLGTHFMDFRWIPLHFIGIHKIVSLFDLIVCVGMFISCVPLNAIAFHCNSWIVFGFWREDRFSRGDVFGLLRSLRLSLLVLICFSGMPFRGDLSSLKSCPPSCTFSFTICVLHSFSNSDWHPGSMMRRSQLTRVRSNRLIWVEDTSLTSDSCSVIVSFPRPDSAREK